MVMRRTRALLTIAQAVCVCACRVRRWKTCLKLEWDFTRSDSRRRTCTLVLCVGWKKIILCRKKFSGQYSCQSTLLYSVLYNKTLCTWQPTYRYTLGCSLSAQNIPFLPFCWYLFITEMAEIPIWFFLLTHFDTKINYDHTAHWIGSLSTGKGGVWTKK